jgi:hypothetical protein
MYRKVPNSVVEYHNRKCYSMSRYAHLVNAAICDVSMSMDIDISLMFPRLIYVNVNILILINV